MNYHFTHFLYSDSKMFVVRIDSTCQTNENILIRKSYPFTLLFFNLQNAENIESKMKILRNKGIVQ